jgi:L-fuconolactonase
MLRPAFCRGIALLEEFGLAYDILVYSRHLSVAAELAERFPSQRFVLDHLGKPDIRHGELCAWEKSLRLLADRSNVSAKLSGLVTEADWNTWSAQDIRPYLDVAFDYFGAGRLMIGSDWPVCTVAGDYTRVMGLVSDYLADRPAQQRDAVLGGNAQRFYNLAVTTGAGTAQ